MSKTEVFLGFKGDVREGEESFAKAVELIASLAGVSEVLSSRLYLAATAEGDFSTAACRLKTSLPPQQLQQHLELIVEELGQKKIDIEILTFGLFYSCKKGLELPHPQLSDNLSILLPLSEVSDTIELPDPSIENGVRHIDVKSLAEKSSNTNGQKVVLWERMTVAGGKQ